MLKSMEQSMNYEERDMVHLKKIFSEVEKLQVKVKEIMDVKSLTSLEKYINSAANFRKLLLNEVEFMCEDIKDEIQQFCNRLYNILLKRTDDETKTNENSAANMNNESAFLKGNKMVCPVKEKSENVLNTVKLDNSITQDRDFTLLEIPDIIQTEIVVDMEEDPPADWDEINRKEQLLSSESSTYEEDKSLRLKILPRFKCPACPKVFYTNIKCSIHCKKKHNISGVSCPICGRHYSCEAHMLEHYYTHTGEKPFECKVCGKRFGRKQSLVVHKRTHSDFKRFMCEVCGKTFHSKYAVDDHMLVHMQKNDFVCTLCDVTCLRRQALLRHMKLQHIDTKQKDMNALKENYANLSCG